jgi:hypothetical protein
MNTIRTYWKPILGVLLIFILGWLAGVISTVIVAKHRMLAMLHAGPMGIAQMIEKRMDRNLSLDTTQQQQVHEALMDNVRQRMQLQSQIQPQIKALNQETLQKIDTVLNADQKARFHKNLEELRARLGPNGFAPGETPDLPAAGK